MNLSLRNFQKILRLSALALALASLSAASPAPARSFATQAYAVLSAVQKDRNFAFSPYSVSRALQLANLGAQGETRKEMDRSLGAAVAPPSSAELSEANRIWVQKGFHLQTDFLRESKRQFGAEPGVLDFSRHAEISAHIINVWVEEQTHHKIKNLIPPNTLNESSRLVLTNAVYFKAPWKQPFIPGDTYDDDFVLTSGRKARVPFMHQRHRHLYFEDEHVQVLELPYAGDRYAMVLALPRTSTSLDGFEKALSWDQLENWSKQLKTRDVRIGMPRFRFDSSYLLNDLLQSLGIRRAFSAQQADFSGMDGQKDLFIGQVFHQAFLNVNEAGTEAAAATAIHMMYGAMLPEAKPVEFTASRPFFFLIRDLKVDGPASLLFMGRVANPRG